MTLPANGQENATELNSAKVAKTDAKEAETKEAETKKSDEKDADQADEKKSDVSEAIAMRRQLELLKIRRKRLGLNYGEAHPTILRMDEEIKSLEKKVKASADPDDLLQRADPKSLEKMSDKELRALVGELVKRVLVLEEEVHTLKESPEISRRFPR